MRRAWADCDGMHVTCDCTSASVCGLPPERQLACAVECGKKLKALPLTVQFTDGASVIHRICIETETDEETIIFKLGMTEVHMGTRSSHPR
mmetsp:Transcript_18038/g.40359  ORF Transcript_18038/g.40359 Transcript_18038/m.40359 type:complete len:91 (-) Transcript_18038:109-381(-)